MSVLLLFFDPGVGQMAIEQLLDGFGGSFRWAKAFEDNDRLYAIRVPTEQTDAWKDALVQLPEVIWAARIATISFVPDHAA